MWNTFKSSGTWKVFLFNGTGMFNKKKYKSLKPPLISLYFARKKWKWVQRRIVPMYRKLELVCQYLLWPHLFLNTTWTLLISLSLQEWFIDGYAAIFGYCLSFCSILFCQDDPQTLGRLKKPNAHNGTLSMLSLH